MRFESSRTLPGHGYSSRRAEAASVKPLKRFWFWTAKRSRKCREQQHVGAARAQRRYRNVDDVDPVVEILAKVAFLHG
jgi:hypothetical protein